MAEGWICPQCQLVLAPSVAQHRCDPPQAAVSVTSISPPGTGGSFTAAAFPPEAVTVNVTGSTVSERDLARAVQRELTRQANRNRPWRAA